MVKAIKGTHKIFDKNICDKEYLDSLIIANPEFIDAQRMCVSTTGISPTISLYTEKDGKIYIPRNLPLNPRGIEEADFKNVMAGGTKVIFHSSINPYEYQEPAIQKLVETQDGILVAGCGKGKTIMALEAAARVGVTTLILVHKEFLMEQWVKNIKKLLGETAGTIQGTIWHWKGHKIVVAMLQTLYSQRDMVTEEFLDCFGLVISDEVHRVSAPTWSQVIGMFPALRRWGLTATPYRADHLEIIFLAHIGDIVYTIEGESLIPTIYLVQTGERVPTKLYYNRWNNQPNIPKMVTALTKIEERNRRILNLLINAAKAGRKILLLTERVEHAKYLKDCLELNTKNYDFTTSLYIGKTGKEERKIAELADIIFGTMQIAKEGLDIPALDTLFLTTPFGSAITAQQSVGRILREYPGKKTPMVIDFVDDDSIGIALAKKRNRVYSELGYTIKTIAK